MATTNLEMAPEEQQHLKKLLSSDKPLALTANDAPEQKVTLPERVKSLLKQIFTELARGRDVTVLAADAEMTTQEAADYLKVSRGYLVRMIDRGEIPSRKVGNQRRLKVSDVQLYEKKMGRIVEPPIKMRDMSKDMRWLSEHRDVYAGKWVAVYEDRLVASGDNAKDVYAEVDRVGLPQTMVTFIEEPLPQRKAERA
ncbi:MAG: excisionase family DNA-binding protein [Acidobacteria bacterium]|nr:excisionase family DNA-binding protein [Acidobacteriota bacterium]